MYLVKELKTYKEIQDEGFALRNGLSAKTYVKRLKQQKIKIYALRKLDDVDTPYVVFAVFPQNYNGDDKNMYKNCKVGNQIVNIRAMDNKIPEKDVVAYVHGWCYANELVEVKPIVKSTPVFNGDTQIMDVYDFEELKSFVIDMATQLLTAGNMNEEQFKQKLTDLGYTL